MNPLIAAILDRPDDDLPRLVYADWIEEQGEPERAEFIRSSISGVWMTHESTGPVRKYCKPLTREQHLQKSLLPGWKLAGWAFPDAYYYRLPSAGGVTFTRPDRLQVVWVRGFAEAVRGSAKTLRRHLPGIVRREPVRRAVVTSGGIRDGLYHGAALLDYARLEANEL